MRKRFREIFFTSLGVIILDRLTKIIVLKILSPGESIPIIKGIFHITFVQNTGIAFGLFKGNNIFFIASSVLIISILIFLILNHKGGIFRICLALVLGGAVGNLIDRLYFGWIVDFLDFRIWPVFNIADSAITIGAIISSFILLKKTKTKDRT